MSKEELATAVSSEEYNTAWNKYIAGLNMTAREKDIAAAILRNIKAA